MPTLFVNDLTNIDCSILHSQRGLIGASWATDIELSGELDEQSMVFDFAKVKKTIKTIIDQEVDHKLLVPTNYQGLEIKLGNNTHLTFVSQDNQVIEHQSPLEAICQLDTTEICRADIIRYLTDRILSALPNNITTEIANASHMVTAHKFKFGKMNIETMSLKKN